MKQEWILMIKQADFAGLSAKFGVPPLLIKLMINRGIGEEEMETNPRSKSAKLRVFERKV